MVHDPGDVPPVRVGSVWRAGALLAPGGTILLSAPLHALTQAETTACRKPGLCKRLRQGQEGTNYYFSESMSNHFMVLLLNAVAWFAAILCEV